MNTYHPDKNLYKLPEDELEKIARTAASNEIKIGGSPQILLLNKVPTILLLVGVIAFATKFASLGRLGIFTVVGSLLVISALIRKLCVRLRAKLLTEKLKVAEQRQVQMQFAVEGKSIMNYVGKVQSVELKFEEDKKLVFNLKPKKVPSTVFRSGVVDATLFCASPSTRPFLVSTQDDAFTVDKSKLAAMHPALKMGLDGAMHLGSTVVLIVLVVMCSSYGMGVPSKTLPSGKTAGQYYDLAVQYKTLGWTEQARAALLKSIELGNGDDIAIKAKRYLDTKIPRDVTSEDAVAMNIKGFNADAPFFHDDAEKDWLDCIRKYPRFEWAYSNLASVYIEEGKYKKADELLDQALKINPTYLNAWLHLAESKRKQHDFVAAHKAIDTAMKLDPTDQEAWLAHLMPDIQF